MFIKSESIFLESSHAAFNEFSYGDWRFVDITDLNLQIQNSFFISFIEYEKIVDFSYVAWKGKNLSQNERKDNCICCNGLRYQNCDTSFPGILIRGAPNPFNLEYRMVDGKHRIEKLISQKKSKSLFYIIEYEKIREEILRSFSILPKFKYNDNSLEYYILWDRKVSLLSSRT
jgi:hypothetical protein